MNCKPGDLAVVVADFRKENIGALVRVISADYGPWDWKVETLSNTVLGLLDGSGSVVARAGQVAGAFDRHLRPIRDPGDDAQDESHAYLPPVPTHQPEVA